MQTEAIHINKSLAYDLNLLDSIPTPQDYQLDSWEMVRLGEVCEMYQPKTISGQEIKQHGQYKVFGANGVIGFYDKFNHEFAEIAMTCRGATCGTINLTEPKSWITGNAMVIKPIKESNLLKLFLKNIVTFPKH